MSKKIIAVEPDATVGEALAQMEGHGIHELPVMTNSTLAGWVSYDHLAKKAHAPPRTKVASVATMPPKLQQNLTVEQAADLMIRHNTRAMPVVDTKGHLVGILSRTDLLRAAQDVPAIADLPLERVMTRDLQTMHEKDSVDDAMRRLRDLAIRQLLVLNASGKLVGAIARDTLVGILQKEDRPSGTEPGQSATGASGHWKDRRLELRGLVEAPIILPSDARVSKALELMVKQQRSYVVVVDDGLPVGVLSRSNIVERLAARGGPPQVPLVQIIGLSNHVDGFVLDQIHSFAQRSLKKIGNEFRIEFLSLHYKVYKAKTEGDSKFSVTGHLSTEQKFLVGKADDWDPIRAADAVLEQLERRAVESKELRLERRKAPGKRRAADPYTAAP